MLEALLAPGLNQCVTSLVAFVTEVKAGSGSFPPAFIPPNPAGSHRHRFLSQWDSLLLLAQPWQKPAHIPGLFMPGAGTCFPRQQIWGLRDPAVHRGAQMSPLLGARGASGTKRPGRGRVRYGLFLSHCSSPCALLAICCSLWGLSAKPPWASVAIAFLGRC